MIMKNIIVCSALLLFCNYATVSAQEATKFTMPDFEKFELDNGLTIYLLEQKEVPMIHLSAIFPAGAIKDTPELSGLSGITAEALLFGTSSYTKEEIEERLDYIGARLYSGAEKETSSLQASFTNKDQDEVLNIIQEVITSPAFDTEEFEKRKARWLVELDQRKESPRSVIDDYFSSMMYANHPYRLPTTGTKASIEDIQQTDIKVFYEKYYRPDNAAIAIAGDFNSHEMKAKITSHFANWESTKAPEPQELTPPILPDSQRVLLVNKDDATETTFYIGAPGIRRNNEDYVGIQVINTILGGRFTSWLNDELRVNSGLTYGARSNFNAMKSGGTFVISTFTKTESTEEAIDLALKTYERLHNEGIDEATLASAKKYIQGQYPPRYETAGNLASLLTDMFYYDFDASFINNFQENVEKINQAKAGEIIEKYFPKDKLQLVLIGKASEIKAIAAKYGELIEKEIIEDGY